MIARMLLTAAASLAIAAAAMLLSPAAARAEALTGPQVGQPAPDFTLTTLDGMSMHLADFRGKTLVLNVWATWCPPCRLETPDLIASYRALHGGDVAFVGVDDTEQAPIVRAFVAAKGIPYPIAIDRDQRFSKAYDIRYFPTTYVIDPQGIVRARDIDVIAPAQLAAFVAAAKRGENGRITSSLQDRIDAVLAAESFPPPADDAAPGVRAAYAKRVVAAIAKAEDLLNRSDPAKGQNVDLLATRAEESALRTRAIATLAAATDDDVTASALLAVMRGDEAASRERWSEAVADYRAALRLRPSDLDALNGMELAAGAAKDARAQIDAAARLAAFAPGDPDTAIELGVTYQKYHHDAKAIAALKRAHRLAMTAYDAKPSDGGRIREVAATHLFLGRAYAAAGERTQARAEFEQLLEWARRIPASNSRHAMYIEEGSEAIAALDLAATQGHHAAPSISLAPWTGPELPGSVPGSIKYRVMMTGAPHSTIALRVANALPAGWIASFCTGQLCSLSRAKVAIPSGGVASIEFQVLRTDKPKPDRAAVHLDASGGGISAHAVTVVDFTR
ncbi:TlpA family protein disulfide reductase [bacterium]|nr:MAG: TlpA family protein disulfide reductase [bacterium]